MGTCSFSGGCNIPGAKAFAALLGVEKVSLNGHAMVATLRWALLDPVNEFVTSKAALRSVIFPMVICGCKVWSPSELYWNENILKKKTMDLLSFLIEGEFELITKLYGYMI